MTDRIFVTDYGPAAEVSFRLRRIKRWLGEQWLAWLARRWEVDQCGVCSRPLTGVARYDVEAGSICCSCADAADFAEPF